MKLKLATIFITVVFAVFAMGTGTVYASQNSLPGDVLYPVKLGAEQARMMLPGDDVSRAELAQSFILKRVEEIEALVEKEKLEGLDIAVSGYSEAMDMAIEKINEARDKGLDIGKVAELVAEATLKHLSILDGVYDNVPEEARPAIEEARTVSMTGQESALRALALENPEKAMEINLAAMEGRLNRAKTMAEENDIEEVENALLQFEEFAEFGEEISVIAQELGMDTTALNELVARAASVHLEILAVVYEKVPEEARGAIEHAMEESAKGQEKAIEALEEAGVLDNIPPVELPIPEGKKEDIPVEIPIQEDIGDKIKNNLDEKIPQEKRGF